VQMPVLAAEAKADDYPPLFPEAAERLAAGIAFLRCQKRGFLEDLPDLPPAGQQVPIPSWRLTSSIALITVAVAMLAAYAVRVSAEEASFGQSTPEAAGTSRQSWRLIPFVY
jgi:hypothetical protein